MNEVALTCNLEKIQEDYAQAFMGHIKNDDDDDEECEGEEALDWFLEQLQTTFKARGKPKGTLSKVKEALWNWLVAGG